MSRNGFWFQSPAVNAKITVFTEERYNFFDQDHNETIRRRNNQTPRYQFTKVQNREQEQSQLLAHSNMYQSSNQASRFDDTSLIDTFNNKRMKMPVPVIKDKLLFGSEESEQIDQLDFQTPPQKFTARSEINQKFQEKKTEKTEAERTTAKKASNFQVFLPQNSPVNSTSRYEKASSLQFSDRKGRPKQKGLRMLSQKAYDIVIKLGSSGGHYKDVANQLVQQLNQEDSVKLDNKDEQNIKRRVYDALNVLIALGVLRKQGRKIYGVLKKDKTVEKQKNQLMEKVQTLNTKRFNLKEKQKKLQNIRKTHRLLKALTNRNIQNNNPAKKFDFPFLGMILEDVTKLKLKAQKENIELFYSGKDSFKPFGDVDIVLMLQNNLQKHNTE